jgi:cardiolipin synthase
MALTQFFTLYHEVIFWGEVIGVLFIPIVLIRKRHPVSAWAWILTVIFIPFLGIVFFLTFGASRVKRRLRRKLYHRSRFLKIWNEHKIPRSDFMVPTWSGMDRYVLRLGGSPTSESNDLIIFEDGTQALDAKIAAIQSAQHHIHLEYFILRADETGQELINLLCDKARAGVRVRLLVDGVGARNAKALLQQLQAAGGTGVFFLPTRFPRGYFTLGLRNHRKLLIIDGTTAFTGGVNVGNEYVGKHPLRKYWRYTHLQIQGPGVLALQRVFAEDWDFAAGELLTEDEYFPNPHFHGRTRLQMAWSGPDQEANMTRETYFVAMTAARRRLWIATPYLVPDGALLAALRSAALRGVDVRVLTQSYPPDHWITYWAGRYFWEDLLSTGIRIFEYQKGMMHSKLIIADGVWASVGSANLDIRSMRLNFELNVHVHSPQKVSEIEDQFEKDLLDSQEIAFGDFKRRPWNHRLLENVFRLFSPQL